MTTEQQAEKLRTLTVEVLLAVRAAHLASPGANPLKHWDMLLTRMRAATRTTANPEQWVTALCRGMQIPALSSSASSAVLDLAAYVAEQGAARDWLRLLDTEYAYIHALTRLAAEKRKEARDADAKAL